MDNFHLWIPIAKIDKETRTVADWATTEAIDKQGEIVDYEASKCAFAEWKGNVREMHEPKAVGKAIEAVPNDNERRMWVKAYISKGAEDTWQKVLDGTLTGFSIGGNTIDKAYQIVKDSGIPRQVTRITKYRLNELSLVDNPANPESTFQLVKMAGDGTLQQTALVEDIKKVVVTEAKDILTEEVKELRDKADALAKKVLTEEDIDKLGDDDFGLVRRFVSPQGTQIKERLFAMPDKVHAYSALKKVAGYPLAEAERNEVHSKAKEVLGSSHKEDDCTICKMTIRKGGDTENMDSKVLEDLVTKMTTLVDTFSNVLKSWQGAHAPVAGAKETPKQEGANPTNAPAVAPSNPEKPGDIDGKTPVTQVSPAAPVTKDVVGEATEKAANPASSDLQTQNAPAAPTGADKAPAAVTAKDGVPAASAPEKSGDPDGKTPVTQESPAVPVKKAEVCPPEGEEKEDEEEVPTEKAANPAESNLHTQDAPAAPVKKVVGSEQDITKLTETVNSLRKQLDDLKKQPLPRKYKVEKTYGAESGEETVDTEDATLEKEYSEVHAEIRKCIDNGTPIPVDLRKRAAAVVDKRLAKKVGSGPQTLVKLN